MAYARYSHVAPHDRRSAPRTILVVAVLGIYAMFDAALLGVAPGQRFLYAGIALCCLFVLVLDVEQVRLARRELLLGSIIIVSIALWTIPVPLNEPIIPLYVLGDIASIAAPFGFLLVGAAYPGIFRSRSTLVFFGVLLVGATVIAVSLGRESQLDRFEPPHNLLIILLWMAFFQAKGIRRWLAAVGLILTLIYIFQSGARASAVLWVLGGCYVIGLRLSLLRFLLIIIPMGIIVGLFAGSIIRYEVVAFLKETRFSENVEGKVDDSLLSRFVEAKDALDEFGRRAEPLNYLIGFGHGATFRPVTSSLRNAVGEGVVHNIHIGPVLILYRYGLLGLILCACLIASVAYTFIQQRGAGQQEHANSVFFTFALAMYLFDWLVHNVLVDPAFSYTLAGFLHFRLSGQTVGLPEANINVAPAAGRLPQSG